MIATIAPVTAAGGVGKVQGAVAVAAKGRYRIGDRVEGWKN